MSEEKTTPTIKNTISQILKPSIQALPRQNFERKGFVGEVRRDLPIAKQKTLPHLKKHETRALNAIIRGDITNCDLHKIKISTKRMKRVIKWVYALRSGE